MFVDVVKTFLDGLKERSKYAVCVKPFKTPGAIYNDVFSYFDLFVRWSSYN